MVYHGPRDHVVPFFEQLGFEIPERKGVADFIQEVCSKKDQEVLSDPGFLPVGFVTVGFLPVEQSQFALFDDMLCHHQEGC